MLLLKILIALTLDRFFSEPKSFHPLVGFGNMANWIENKLNTATASKKEGAVAYAVIVVPVLAVITVLQIGVFNSGLLNFIFASAVLYLGIGWQSLKQHALAIYEPLIQGDLVTAREKLALVVSRDTEQLTAEQITSATIETVLENGSDAIFASLFWFILLGPVGVVWHRLSNTLDAMWGYKNERFFIFGWAAAKMDDLLNYLPARCCAFIYALVGNFSCATQCWRQQAPQWKSPNAGPVMASGAGALYIRIGGAAIYHGEQENKPYLGEGPVAQAEDIKRSLQLIDHSLLVWLAICGCLSVLLMSC